MKLLNITLSFLFLAIATGGFSQGRDKNPNGIKVFILAGQSNMDFLVGKALGDNMVKLLGK